MKYNNGDMDDLFRRASEGYPLRTDSADWDRLASALDGVPAPASDQEKRRRRGVFWWFLLIPLAGVGYLTWQADVRHSAGNDKVVKEQRVAGKVTGEGGASGAVTTGGSVGGTSGAGGVGGSGGAGGVGGSGTDGVGGSGGKAVGGSSGAGGVGGSSRVGGIGGSSGAEVPASGGGKVRNLPTPNDDRSDNRVVDRHPRRLEKDVAGASGRNATGGLKGADGVTEPGGSGVTGAGNSGVTGSNGSAVTEADEDHQLVLALLDLRRAPIGGGYHVDVDVVGPKAAANTVPAGKKQNKKNSHGYIGVLGAPDFSTVRFQTMKGVGTTFGVLLGYSFNDRWAVETGLSLDRKRYYSAGEYFNTKKVTMPPGYTKLLSVDGTCNMWEIPVNVRYNFSTNPRMKWFATAGLSTYLMTSENYTYQVENNWSREDSNWNIHKPSQYLFSIVNLSVGFEQRVGKIGNLRLEPYVRIPLSGIGTGNLPIMSAGLNIGFTRQLW